jgi:hypothetical protein
MTTKHIQYILPFLDKKYKKAAEWLLEIRRSCVITNHKKMWKPKPKPLLRDMTRSEVIKELRSFRDAWQTITTRSQDLSNTWLADPSFTTLEMKKRLKWYYSTECKLLAENWLRQYFADCYTRS